MVPIPSVNVQVCRSIASSHWRLLHRIVHMKQYDFPFVWSDLTFSMQFTGVRLGLICILLLWNSIRQNAEKKVFRVATCPWCILVLIGKKNEIHYYRIWCLSLSCFKHCRLDFFLWWWFFSLENQFARFTVPYCTVLQVPSTFGRVFLVLWAFYLARCLW